MKLTLQLQHTTMEEIELPPFFTVNYLTNSDILGLIYCKVISDREFVGLYNGFNVYYNLDLLGKNVTEITEQEFEFKKQSIINLIQQL